MQGFERRDVEEVQSVIGKFTKKYDVSPVKAVKLFSTESVPISIFSSKLSPLETIVKFLKENSGMGFTKIANLLYKKTPSIWTAYKNAKQKQPRKFSWKISSYDIPLKELRNKKLSLLEALSLYLKEELGLTFREIGSRLKRNERTIWTTYKRAKRKNG